MLDGVKQATEQHVVIANHNRATTGQRAKTEVIKTATHARNYVNVTTNAALLDMTQAEVNAILRDYIGSIMTKEGVYSEAKSRMGQKTQAVQKAKAAANANQAPKQQAA